MNADATVSVCIISFLQRDPTDIFNNITTCVTNPDRQAHTHVCAHTLLGPHQSIEHLT